MKTYELRKRKDLESSILRIALVESPAIEVGFVALSKNGKQSNPIKLSEEQMMLYTPLVIPYQEIPRIDEETGEQYNVKFAEDTCKEILHDFLRANLTEEFNSEHDENKPIKGLKVLENWIVDDPNMDRAVALGFVGIPKGTPMLGISLRDNPEEWAKCKDGTYKGISLEGLFDNYEVNLSTNKNSIMNKAKVLLSEALALLGGSAAKTKLASAEMAEGGAIYFEGELGEATVVFSDEAMSMALADGDYTLANGQTVTVLGGSVSAVVEMEAAPEVIEEAILSMDEVAEAISRTVESQVETQNRVVSGEEAFKVLDSIVAELTKDITALKSANVELSTKLTKLGAEPADKSITKLGSEPKVESKIAAHMNRINLKTI